jgi:hypothetical protein
MGGSYRRKRKQQLVSLGLWAVNAGKGWLVKAVQLTIQREGLTHE